MKRLLLILLISLSIVKTTFGQSLSIFETKLYNEKLTICDLINNYVDKQKDFNYKSFDTAFYCISVYDNRNEIFGNWSFVVRNDSLNQIGFTSLDLPINSEWFDNLYSKTDTIIKLFTGYFGQPLKQTRNEKNFFKKGEKYLPGDILKAMWDIDGQKIKVEYIIDGEHNDFHYSLRILRFKDYYGNIKLPEWWDGY